MTARNRPSPAAPDVARSARRALTAHLPGMAYQIVRPPGGAPRLVYASTQSQKLLGIAPGQLIKAPERFFDLILPEDRSGYRQRLETAPGGHLSFDWEGRIWVEAWKDVKWINLRVGSRETPAGTVWDGIMLNVTRSKETEAELARSRAQLAALTAHAEKIREQERLAIARELHDDLGGNLTAVKIGLAWLIRHMPADPLALRERAAYLDGIVDETIEAAHRIASDLRPSMLDFGIVAAIRWQVTQFARNTELSCTFTSSDDTLPLDPERAIAVFRIVQEALTNIAKHARARHVAVTLTRRRGQLEVSIADDGVGVEGSGARAGFGLIGMRERAAALGGSIAIEAQAPAGTRVRLRLPIVAAARKIRRRGP
jgi:signal transduction histidine kinase